MKKCILWTIGVLLFSSCSKQLQVVENSKDLTMENSQAAVSNSNLVNEYLEEARWGNVNAYMKLAECYHKGIGVKPDIMTSVAMLSVAKQYRWDCNLENYIEDLPETDDLRLIFETVGDLDHQRYEHADSIIEMMIANGSANGYALKGVLQIEQGDVIKGKQTIQMGAELGSSFAELMLCTIPERDEEGVRRLNIEMLAALSDRAPLANQKLGDYYSGIEDDHPIDVHLAAKYYQKADEQGCLGKRPAQWLLEYYQNEGITIDSIEKRRLQILSGTLKN